MDDAQFQALKGYMNVSHDLDDDKIRRLHCAAVQYLAGAGIAQDGSDLAWLAAAGLTLHWYDNPGLEGGDEGAPLGLRQIINQLKLDAGGESYF